MVPRQSFFEIQNNTHRSNSGQFVLQGMHPSLKTDFNQVHRTLQRNLDLCIPRQGIAQPQSVRKFYGWIQNDR
jgi:hypothetical protein